jgi:hypothetical protein
MSSSFAGRVYTGNDRKGVSLLPLRAERPRRHPQVISDHWGLITIADCQIFDRRKLLILNGEMLERSIRHAWKAYSRRGIDEFFPPKRMAFPASERRNRQMPTGLRPFDFSMVWPEAV